MKFSFSVLENILINDKKMDDGYIYDKENFLKIVVVKFRRLGYRYLL